MKLILLMINKFRLLLRREERVSRSFSFKKDSCKKSL